MSGARKVSGGGAQHRELTSNPRLAAFWALKAAENGQAPDEYLNGHGLLLEPKNMALATALVYEVLRHKLYLDSLIESRLKAGRSPEALKQILRLGLAQILFFDRLGDHAILMETVALAKKLVPGRQGVVNAILRGFLRRRDEGPLQWPPLPPLSGDPIIDLSLKYSYPHWIVALLVERLGLLSAEKFFISSLQATTPTLRVNPLKSSREALQNKLTFECRPTKFSPWGLMLDSFHGRPETWPGFAEGHFSIQDEVSQLVALLAPLKAGARLADVCAGLGGKSLCLAAVYPGAHIVAMDKDPLKLDKLTTEAGRLGCSDNISTVVNDLLSRPLAGGGYDVVLLDAPCSGLGVLRRRPDIKWNKEPQDIARLADLQLSLLQAAAGGVKAGGRLIYAVCSITYEEGPGQIKNFLSLDKRFTPVKKTDWPESLQACLDEHGFLSMWPHVHGSDGFFWAVLERI